MDRIHLPQARDALLLELKKIAIANPLVSGIFLGGSLAAGNADDWSDIDLRLVTAGNTQQVTTLLSEIVNRLESEGRILFIETYATNYAVLHFPEFVKVDLFVYSKSTLLPSPWLASINILNDDSQNYLAKVKAIAKKLPLPIDQSLLDGYLMKYYANLHDFYRRWQRGESNYLHQDALMIKHCLVSLWYLKAGQLPNNLGDWSKYEGPRSRLTPEQIAALTLFTPLAAARIPDFLQWSVNCIAEAASAIATTHGLTFSERQHQQITELVL